MKLSQEKKLLFFYIIYLINKKISLFLFSAFHLSHWVLFDGVSFFLKTVGFYFVGLGVVWHSFFFFLNMVWCSVFLLFIHPRSFKKWIIIIDWKVYGYFQWHQLVRFSRSRLRDFTFYWPITCKSTVCSVNIIPLGLCMGCVRSGWGDFLTQPILVGQKNFNSTQPIT